MIPGPVYTFNNGIKVPAFGLGCWMGSPKKHEETEQMVKLALKYGYRHFDTAAGYGNEVAVGKAMRESGVPREEIFVVTKLASSAHHRVKEAFEDSLNKLNIGYIDLWLMHAPTASINGKRLLPEESPTYVETWKEMEKVYQETPDKVRAIGVSNFIVEELEVLLQESSFIPVTNQVEIHPAYPQNELLEYCNSKKIILTAYSPLGQYNSPFFRDAILQEVAMTEKATVAQVLISWGIQRGTIVIPKTEKEERLIENAKLFKLSPESMSKIDSYHTHPGFHRPLFGN